MSNPAGIVAFPPEAFEKFEINLHTSKNRSIFDLSRRASYRNWFSNPNASVGNGLPKKERSRLRSEKRRALQSFCLDLDIRKIIGCEIGTDQTYRKQKINVMGGIKLHV